MIQRETELIVKPFRLLLLDKGWDVENIHGNQFQRGLPDLYISHPNFAPRWVECKVFNKYNKVKLTDAQRVKFPIFVRNHVPFYVIAAHDLRGKVNKEKRKRMYLKLFKEPNGWMCLNPMTHSLLI
jgi:hypothetical protein